MLLRIHLGLILTALATARAQDLNCDPCINRKAYTIKAILHGSSSHPFWQQVLAAAIQSGKDMGVNFEVDLYENYFTSMGNAIISTATSKPDALIVSFPNESVGSTVDTVLSAGVPIFGVHMGDQIAKGSGILDFVGMDQDEGGVMAAKELIKIRQTNIGKALFVNHDQKNEAFQERQSGFESKLWMLGATVNVVGGSKKEIENALHGCTYDAILLASSDTLSQTIEAMETKGCREPVGTFDTNQEVFDEIAFGKLSFAVGEQPFLQGALPVLMASMFASTGKKIVPPTASKTHIYLAGPKIYNIGNLPSKTTQMCEVDGFPVCLNTIAPDGSNAQCKCTDRAKIKIGEVLHGVTTDSFWDPVFAASEQAAKDTGIDLLLDHFEPVDYQMLLHEKMGQKMEYLCDQDIHGLFVTIPSDKVVPALEHCKSLNIPIISVNTGIETSVELDLVHHIGMLEYDAGVGAGQCMIQAGMKKGICLDHEPGNTALVDRCNGFNHAIEQASGVEYLGRVEVPLDNPALYKSKVESKVDEAAPGTDEDWDGIGMFLLGPAQTAEALNMKEGHKKVLMGSVDTSDEMYKAMDEGKILFGIQQGPYMQGYMPIPLLTYLSYTHQALSNRVVQSGPSFVEKSPKDDLQVCEKNLFGVCETPKTPETPETGTPSLVGATTSDDSSTSNRTALIASLVVIFGVLFLVVGFMAYRLNKLNQHVKELRSRGTAVPNLSFSKKMSSAVKPVDQVVESVIT